MTNKISCSSYGGAINVALTTRMFEYRFPSKDSFFITLANIIFPKKLHKKGYQGD